MISPLESCWRPRAWSACTTTCLSKDVDAAEGIDDSIALDKVGVLDLPEDAVLGKPRGARLEGTRRGPAGAFGGRIRFIAAEEVLESLLQYIEK